MKYVSSLAPMAGYTDTTMRKIAGELGAGYAVSEMISAVALCMHDRKTGVLAKISEGEPPTVLQIFGHDPKIMAQAAELLLSGSFVGRDYASPPAGIDINMGCPVRKIVTSGDGSALMRTPELAFEIAKRTAEVCGRYGVPLSVKLRAGWDHDSVNCAELAVGLVRAGAARITLHCRTRDMMYMPSADPSYAASVADALREAGLREKVRLVGNGDIDSPEAARRYIDSGCDEVAVGRAALGNPWIFTQLSRPDEYTAPDVDTVKAMAIRLVRETVALRGETAGIRESRSRAAYFIKGMRGSARLRDSLNHAETLAEFVRILTELAV